MMVLTSGGTYREAWDIITNANPFPAITGMVCPHICENGCNRQYLDSAVNINEIERFIGEWGIKEGLSFKAPDIKNGKDVAVIGSGPSGMSCAYQLARLGYKVTVYEANDKPGGMLRYAIPGFRLSSEIIDSEYRRVTEMGVELKLGTTVGKDIAMDELISKYHAVYVANGASKSKDPDFTNSGTVVSGLDFLRNSKEGTKLKPGTRVLVIGGGNTAIDAARTARRQGAAVTILYRRSRKEMPAFDEEINDALDEGITIEYLAAPEQISCADDGKNKIRCTRMRLCEQDDSGRSRPEPIEGSEFDIDADLVIYAIGQEVAQFGFDKIFHSGRIATDETFMTNHPGVFAGGDAVTGPATVTAAIGYGRKAALSINAFLTGKKYKPEEKKEISFRNVPITAYKKSERNYAAKTGIEERLQSMDARVSGCLNPDQVHRESERCFTCGKYKSEFVGADYFGKVCLACHNCEAICPHDALSFPNYYRVEKGRGTNSAFRIPAQGEGFPNPFMETKPPQFEQLEKKITDVERLIYRRRSNRVFTDEQVPKEMIHRIIEAGRFAPSAGNAQPWKFVVIRDRSLMDKLSAECVKTLGMVTKIYQGKNPLRKLVKNGLALFRPDAIDMRPMVAIQALLTPKFKEDQMDIFFGATTVIYVLVHHMGISTPIFSTGMCCQNIALAAHSIGLGTCFAGFATEPVNMSSKLKKLIGVTWPYDHVATAIVVGFPAVQIDQPVEREFPQVDWIE